MYVDYDVSIQTIPTNLYLDYIGTYLVDVIEVVDYGTLVD